MSLDDSSISTDGVVSHTASRPLPSQPQSQRPAASTPAQSRPRVCRFFNTNKGCRAGSQCPYRHVQPNDHVTNSSQKHDQQHPEVAGSSALERQSVPHRARATVPRPAPASKPISQLQQTNPREFQITQVIRRFASLRSEIDDGTLLSFTLAPSDPDFPFDLDGLQCKLTVPTLYPQDGAPAIRVSNPEMARGYQINVERGFDSLVAQSPNKTLLALMNELDKNLEKFLTSEKAQTIKIIANAEKKFNIPEPPLPQEIRIPKPAPVLAVPPQPSWTSQQKQGALAKRQVDVRQLEARMGRLPKFSKSADGTSFNIPVQIPRPGTLPTNLQSLKEVSLTVPVLYNLEPCTVQLKGVSGPEVENVQLSFEKHVRETRDMTLMAHINYLTQNIHSMASESVNEAVLSPEAVQIPPPLTEPEPDTRKEEDAATEGRILDDDRPHVKIIPRPPEWDHRDSDSQYETESSYDTDEYTESEDDDPDDGVEHGGVSIPTSSVSSEKGIHLYFPGLELHNIELLILASLSLSVKCLRCKSPSEVVNVKPSNPESADGASSVRTESCPKCTTPFTLSFVPNALHTNTTKAGTIEATGCTITDMLPSIFQPTCSSCSTTFPVPPGMTSVRADTPIQVCRSCHSKMTFTIHEVKFLRVSHAPTTLPLRRPKKENLGISAGTPLPKSGTCAHYRHSYRWFRFGCCGRVYPCDRCHDTAEQHFNERADRMICGWCSREQKFRAEDCGLCGHSVMRRKKAVGGFWEGGRGTRDRALMSRKEKRKYKRPPASVKKIETEK